MNREKIENLDELLKQHIGYRKIINTTISRLTAPGENYGALLLRVDITLEKNTDMPEQLHVIAKCIPINSFFQKMFNVQVSVKKEIAFYDTIVPLLQDFQKEQGVNSVMDLFPKLYGARINLSGSDVVDENAAIMLENLVQSGYKNVNRSIGFDLETSKLVLQNLATFHAVPLAFRLSKPDIFEKRIKPHLTELIPSLPQPSPESEGDLQVGVLEFLESQEEFCSLMPTFRELFQFHPGKKTQAASPFYTITHGDIWGNNIMVKFEDSKPVSIKFIDFQNFALRSLAADLIFLLFSSLQTQILEEDLEELIKLYHDKFIEHLVQLKQDCTPFSLENFLEEIKLQSRLVLFQLVFMVTYVIFGKEGGNFTNQDPSKPLDLGGKDDITPQAKERITYIIRKYREKGWL